jgi:hypothetical protein
MLKKTANIFSIILHPLLMPTIGLFLIFNSKSYLSFMPIQEQKVLFMIIFVNTCVFPISIIPFFIYQKLIKNIKLSNRKERIFPLSITIIFYFFTYLILHKLIAPIIIQNFILGSFISILLLLLINLKWKISAHMIGIGGIVGLILALSMKLIINLQVIIMTLFVVSGILGSVRLYLNEHNPLQIYSGFMLGLLVVLTTILFL